ncbi:polysaccharide biosynthesis protein [Agromyces badenianii]|uniref:Polysaccharide biosynthesis protein n=1 Tax=Agromyces badenianii TaxID=2080742 RepID=A0A2S0WXY4_9MICO|nr:nucleoside-diphosphate sugar epimerase/dehydratase [Agromyces badenianii]AWB96152.1 polysaccharide biosynthesis protein [Agromyces badenianii]
MAKTDSPERILERGFRAARPVRLSTQFGLDAGAWALAIVLAEVFRYEFDLSQVAVVPMLLLIASAVVLQLAIGWTFHLYRGRFTYGTFEEVRALSAAVVVVAVVLCVPTVLFGTSLSIPRSTILIALPIGLLFMCAARYMKRLYVERRVRPGLDAQRVLVYGAGYLGATLIRRMMTDPDSPYLPVALIDDQPAYRNVRHSGVAVRGTLSDLERIASETDASAIVVAIASADASFLRRVNDEGERLGLHVKVLPRLDEILSGEKQPSDLRDISIEDLIGRHPVDTDVGSIAGYLAGKRVLVTGAGGSIGSELCRQIVQYGPAELIMLDRDETGLQMAQLGTAGHGLLDTRDVVLADIRDVPALQAVFEERRPEVVFHAAALKHLPMLEQYPDEAWKTNVMGTLNVLNAAREVGVDTFVNISTDKAANPTSVLGHSKRVAEKLTAWMATETGLRYLSVRFGNVIGSRGSMLPTFSALIKAGGPITVTHPEVTRFFMTIPEACQLVVQAGGIGKPAEVLILDMGEPVRILDVAERMIEMSGKDIEIVFTGLREGEKLHEELVGASESTDRPLHPKISHARVNSISPERLDKAGWEARIRSARRTNEAAVLGLGDGALVRNAEDSQRD